MGLTSGKKNGIVLFAFIIPYYFVFLFFIGKKYRKTAIND
ncbi:hypothetical protein HMPREF3201_00393 [Megasphaera sp. MJR8396C]|nr:hypothetical protein HMPREF3201_00393 [Megasphaera sp. MJR8396C]